MDNNNSNNSNFSENDLDEAEAQVKEIVQIAKTKGVEIAIKLAKDKNDNYILDRVHDELVKFDFNKEDSGKSDRESK